MIAVCKEEHIIDVPDLGVTLRTLLGAAASSGVRRRKWRIRYKHVIIGEVRIKDDTKAHESR